MVPGRSSTGREPLIVVVENGMYCGPLRKGIGSNLLGLFPEWGTRSSVGSLLLAPGASSYHSIGERNRGSPCPSHNEHSGEQ
jgi:hypothetical protein